MIKNKAKKIIGLINFSNSERKNKASRRFREEAARLNYKIQIFDHYLFFVSFKKGELKVYYDEKKIDPQKYLAFIPTVSIFENLPDNTFSLDCLKQLGLPIINDPLAIRLAKNKTQSLFKLALHNVPITPSAVNFSQYKLGPLFKFIKKDDFICKINKSSLGKGVALIKTKISLISIFELLAAKGVKPSTLIFQKFITGSKGKDIRVIVVGNQAIAAMERSAQGIDFRSNISSGGQGKKIDKIPTEIKKIAVKAIKILGLDYGGVDILLSRKKPMIIEVNANPGLEIENITDKNVTKKVLQHIIKKYQK